MQALDQFYNKKPSKAKDKRHPRTFKLKRAQMNHLQTLREISAQREKEDNNESKPGTSSQI